MEEKEATASEPTEGQTVTTESVPEAGKPEATEVKEVVTEAPKEASEDWWDTNGLDEKTAKRVKSIQTEFNKKATEASQLRGEAGRAKHLEQQLGTVTDSVRQAILSPNWQEEVLKARQQLMVQMGVPSEQPQPPQPKKLENAEDLMDYLNQREQWQEKRLRQEYETKLAGEISKIATPIARDRWQQADSSLKNAHPLYDKYSSRVLQAVATGPYQGLYSKGMGEREVLETAFKVLAFEDIVGNAKQEALKSFETKKNVVTEKPKKATQTTKAAKSKEDIIEEIRRSGHSFEVTQ